MFRKICEDKVEQIQKKHLKDLERKCDKIIKSVGCDRGACMQSGQLRTEIVQVFKNKCKINQGDSNLAEKRGLLDGLLGERPQAAAMDLSVENPSDRVNKVVGKTVTLLAVDVVLRLVDVLSGTVKSVVDSFVSNCN
ncbi:hypothetical protein BGX27_005604 [Mortierella sp. AM989]|nr:hypothetical protein BGX27_005604 [Mortierella sp. AM989]